MPRTKKAATTEKSTPDTDDAKKKRVRHTYLYATGRRKKAVARVRLYKKGEGKITVNERAFTNYFPTTELQTVVMAPLEAVGKPKEFDFTIRVAGGGPQGQAVAVQHGIARALVLFDKDLRTVVKPHGYLKRDPRRKERKKPGLKRARKAPQWAKR